jgi:hypothetical protein
MPFALEGQRTHKRAIAVLSCLTMYATCSGAGSRSSLPAAHSSVIWRPAPQRQGLPTVWHTQSAQLVQHFSVRVNVECAGEQHVWLADVL